MADSAVPGISRVLLPVAMIAWEKVRVSVPPALSSTAMVPASVNRP